MNVGKYLKSLKERFLCFIGDHDWTSKAEQRIPPDKDKIKADPIKYFWDYSAMYCKRCNHKYKGNVK